MFDAGVESPLGELLGSVRAVVGAVDVDGLEVPEAVRLVEECAEAERLFAALRVVVGATLEGKAMWRREGTDRWRTGWRPRRARPWARRSPASRWRSS